MSGQRLGERFKDQGRIGRGERERFENVRAPAEFTREVEAVRSRKRAAEREIEKANEELGILFARLLEQDWDLKAAAAIAGVSRTTAYKWAAQAVED